MRLRLGIAVFAGAALLLPALAFAAPGSLTFIEAEVDGTGGVTGLQGPALVATSPDARHVYAVSYSDDSLVAFARDPGNGGLSFVEAEIDDVGGADGLDGAFGVAVAPDGRHVYVGSYAEGQDLNVSGAVATFDRDPATGAVTYAGHVLDDIAGVDGLNSVEAVALSPDGRHLYAAGNGDDSVPVFARDLATGALTFVEREEDGVGGVDGIDDPEGITVSPDGLSVYTASPTDDAVAHFVRDPVTGALSFGGQDRDGVAGVNGLADALGVAASPDGRNVYATGGSDDAVVTFGRDVSTGALTFLELDQDGVGGVDGLDGARNVVVSPDGAHVYVVSRNDNAVVSFDRDPATGTLSFLELDADGAGGVDGLADTFAVDVSCDGAHVFTTGQSDNALSSFSREGPPGDCAPDLTLTAKRKQKLRKRFAVNVSCGNEACALEAAATLRLGRRSKPLAPVVVDLGYRETRALELTLNRRLRRKAARALENRKKVSAAVAVSVADLAGNVASAETTVKLKRRRKR